jgi:DNA-binding response OmpR family regulator/tetratricopeptide (TPR) repeat protein
MKRKSTHILVVDDDATQGKALLEAFTRAGYQVTWSQTSVQALTAAQRTEFQVLMVDCMLPKMNGVDLVEELLQLGMHKPKVFLFSGIFKDKKFIKDSMERTSAVDFFDKPLDLPQVLGRVEEALQNETEADDPPLLTLYSGQPPPPQELVRLFERESPMSSIHLPVIFRHMQRTQLSGDMTVINAVGDMNTISFWDGKIFAVRTPDKDSYFGGLAVSFGFVSPDDVMEALKTPTRALLGQKLIQSFALSPHAIHVIMEEQLALRLSQTIQHGVVSLQWAAKKYSTPDYALNPVRYEQLAADWVNSKLTAGEIRSQLLLWGNFNIEGDFHPSHGTATTLQEFLNTTSGARDLLYLFHNLIRGQATLSGSVEEETANFTFLEHRLDKLLQDYKVQNYFQILGVGERAQSNEFNKAYNELKEYFDPANLPKDCPPALMVKCTKVFQYIRTAYDTLSDDVRRNAYILQEQNKRAQEMLEMEPVFRAGILELANGHPREAAKKFQSLLDRKLEFRDLKSYRIWSGLKCDRNYKDLTLDQVPPEERHSAPYMMAKGVYFRTRRQYQKALEAYRSAHVLDPRMSIAKIELKKLMAEIDKRGDKNLLSEVTSVVENLFTKIGRKGA